MDADKYRWHLGYVIVYLFAGIAIANPPLPVESPPDSESGSRLPHLAAGLAIGTSGDYIRVIHV